MGSKGVSSLRNADVTVYVRQNCCLCDDALAVVEPLARRFGACLRLVDIDTDPALQEAYQDKIPVVTVDGQPIAYGAVSALRLRRALEGEGPSSRYLRFLKRWPGSKRRRS